MSKIIIASGPVIVEGETTLLVKEGSSDFWKFPGGKVENCDATLAETARREVKEEMALEIKILEQKPFLMYVTKKTSEEKIDVILAHFLAKRIGEIVPGDDIREWAWIPILELDELAKKDELAPNIIPTLKHFGVI